MLTQTRALDAVVHIHDAVIVEYVSGVVVEAKRAYLLKVRGTYAASIKYNSFNY